MEKFGVVTTEETSTKCGCAGTCPNCGKELEKTANVPKCPDEGTAPFEENGCDHKGSPGHGTSSDSADPK